MRGAHKSVARSFERNVSAGGDPVSDAELTIEKEGRRRPGFGGKCTRSGEDAGAAARGDSSDHR